MHNFTEVLKKDAISYKDFIEEHVKKGIPVIFKNASSVWKSNKMFTPEFFSKHFGSHQTQSEGITYTMDQILEITAKSTPENPAPYPILFEIPIQMPELMEMLQPLHMNYAVPNWFDYNLFPYGKFGKNIHLFIGGKGNQYSLHKDFFHTNAWITQLYGEKKFVVFPGGQDEQVYVQGKNGYSQFLSPVNVQHPDFDKYPEYQKATPISITLQPGETIFIPNGVWHTTFSPGHNISLIFDQMNGYNYKSWKKDMFDLKKDEGKVKALINYVYAVSAGTLAKTAQLTGIKI